MLSAVIFDFDGVIVDTEPLHCRAFQQILEPHGISFTWEEYLETYVGYDDRDALKAAFESLGEELDEDRLLELISVKGDAFEQLVSEQGAKPYKGIHDLVEQLVGKLPVALCSGALRRDIDPILVALDFTAVFDVIVTADDVSNSKPHPESYELAVRLLAEAHEGKDIQPRNCVAIEDTPAGIEAASGAGLSVVGVTNSYPEERLAGACCTVESMEDVTLAMLEACAG
jgi:beta-phosphoglucomutase